VSLQSVASEIGAVETNEWPARDETSRFESRSVNDLRRVVRVGFLGYGRVGQAVAAVAEKRRGRLLAANLDLRCVDALVRDPRKVRPGPRVRLSTDAACVVGSGVDVIVEVLGGLDPARHLVEAALDAGIPVVSANKTLVAAAGAELRALASRRRTAFAFDAAVLAGVPFLGSLSRRPLVAEAGEIAGILNGTSNFILSEMAQGAPFEKALRAAIARGYAEPDSSADITGLDAAQKLSVLLQLAGCAAVPANALPASSLKILRPRDLVVARSLGGSIKPIAFASLAGDQSCAWVGPAFVREGHPLSRITGVENGLRITSVNGHAVMFAGPGAGPEVTAVTILDDIAEIFTGGLSSPLAGTEPSDRHSLRFDQPPTKGWFVRVRGIDLQPGHVAEVFAARGVPLLHVLRDRGDVVGLTAEAGWFTVQKAAEALRAIGTDTTAIPIVER
jgi:homoserine dehydrogenase